MGANPQWKGHKNASGTGPSSAPQPSAGEKPVKGIVELVAAAALISTGLSSRMDESAMVVPGGRIARGIEQPAVAGSQFFEVGQQRTGNPVPAER